MQTMSRLVGAAALAAWLVGCGGVEAEDEGAQAPEVETTQQAVTDPAGWYYRCVVDTNGYQTGQCVVWFSLGCGPATTRHCTAGVYAPATGQLCGRPVNATVCD
ncbi:hypothetical protein JY651_01840 [Pyxidicoccus parkwayensis]|uniref:Lipoprotein n=1 Tax=Pyxidicoccus parkwayensis TaxID=2813578 RepID=A0ABX7NZI3_9BACT|nr:hypothetical protein [Pyxidicoccus parkwaysis]QSQ23754.1 hypothetical protein JY651_01840 [Pyxidicoccus parkwaysis]